MRRSSRITQNPTWPKDFVLLCDSFGYTHISTEYACYLSFITKIHEPSTYAEVVKNPDWVLPMNLEITAFEDNHTWDIATLPPKNKVIGCKWVYNAKYNSDGTL